MSFSLKILRITWFSLDNKVGEGVDDQGQTYFLDQSYLTDKNYSPKFGDRLLAKINNESKSIIMAKRKS